MSHTTSSLARHAEQIARALLGTPSKAHSTAAQLRYGSHGSLALEIAGDKIGTWYDHEQEVGGGLLDLIERKRKCNRAAAIEWLKSIGVDTQRGNGAAGGQQQRREAIYIYHSRAGTPLYCVVRWSPVKTFSQHPYDLSTGTFATGKGAMKGVELVPYRLPELLADPAARIWTAEGEKAVDRLAGLGLVATCNPGGAGKWPASFARWFTGRDIAILPDADAAGKAHAQDVAAKLQGSAASVRILELPDLPAKGDISDWLDRGGTVEQLQTLVESASLYPPYNRATAQHLPALATEPSILAVFGRDVALRGLVGECAVAQLLYLAITSDCSTGRCRWP